MMNGQTPPALHMLHGNARTLRLQPTHCRSQATVEDQLVIRGLTNVPTGVYVVETGAGRVKTAPKDMFRQDLEPGMSPRTPAAQDDIAQCSASLSNLLPR